MLDHHIVEIEILYFSHFFSGTLYAWHLTFIDFVYVINATVIIIFKRIMLKTIFLFYNINMTILINYVLVIIDVT
jgi:hypothetical protein